MAGGTARDALCSWSGEAVQKSGAGIWSPEGPFIVAASTRVRFFRLPSGSPGGTCPQASTERKRGQVDEITDEPLYRDRVCGIDIGKAQMVATIRVPSDLGETRRAHETRTFAPPEDLAKSWHIL